MLELNNNRIIFDGTTIFLAPSNEKAKLSFENVKDISITEFSKYDVINNSILPSGEIKLNLYNNTKLPSQYITFVVIDDVLFVKDQVA